MRFSLLTKDILTDKSDVLLIVAAAAKDGMLMSPKLKALDERLDGLLSAAKRNGFCAAAAETLVLTAVRGNYARVVLIGKGKTLADTTTTIADAVATLGDISSLTLWCENDEAAAATTAAISGAYRYRLGAELPLSPLKHLKLAASLSPKVLMQCAAIGEGTQMARHLAEQPGNICTPAFLARTAQQMAKKFSALSVKILDKKHLQTLKMGAFLAVAQGSIVPPKMIVFQYKGARGAPVALVGKGVTFDTGGISLKPAAAMDEMKFDMGGAASVFGTILACARMKLPLHVVGIVPACENMPGGGAIKPGDIVRAMNGKSIEILNTDAEGRLILADALTYCQRYKPNAVIDIATLTGACVIALGHHTSGMMSRDEALADELLAAGMAAGDECWRLPLGDKYQRQLKTDYADLANIGGRTAGTITAACFLSHFVECDSWAHLDIAGTAWTPKKRATGRPAPLLANFLINRAAAGR